ncbi:hypothetical protein VDA_000264 [Photobacterium damselae subsp. damselae CIP 102761]|uniref:Uncharacterized protein n=2 Tax=Photobacterium damselae TaxID=38293 RepID=D0Z531_PHODD|nr:hypothetical protein VDA_000264 [Photobacterium damselae subsp. damselae CIP 102761]
MAAFDPSIRVPSDIAAMVNAKFDKFSEESKEKSHKFILGEE